VQHAFTDFTSVLSTVFQSYDYRLQKVKISTRIPLRDIVGIIRGHSLTPKLLALPHLTVISGAYIVSPLEEASRDPIQNAGFSVEWRNAHQFTRVTSYCVRNSVEISASPTGPYVVSLDTPSTSRFSGSSPTVQPPLSTPRPSVSPKRTAASASSASDRRGNAPSMKPRPPPLLPRAPTRSRLSRLLYSTAPPALAPLTSPGSDAAAAGATSFAAFKALPIDPARTRRDDSSGSSTFVEPAAAPDEFAGTCREAVDYMVDSIVRACIDASDGDSVPVVRQEEIVRSVCH
jgi:hypothetical protein